MAEENQRKASETEKQVDFGYRAVPESEKEEDVKEVFESVAKRYDLMNDVLSLGLHRLWKSTCVSLSGAAEGQKVLDIASGTCDMAIRFGEAVGKSGEVWATDINHEMIKEGVKRLKAVGCKAHVAICDCEALPFEDNFFDIAVVSFGLRNMTHKDRALKEMMRVVRPGRVAWWCSNSAVAGRSSSPSTTCIPSNSCRGSGKKSRAMRKATVIWPSPSVCIPISRRLPRSWKMWGSIV